MKALQIVLLLFVCSSAAACYSQAEIDEEGKAILATFAAKKIPTPQLGWVLPNGELVSEVKDKEVTILTEKVAVRVAPQIGVIPANAVIAFVQKNKVDCDQYESQEKPVALYRYDAKLPPSRDVTRVFVFAGNQKDNIQAGYVVHNLSKTQSKPIWLAMKRGKGQRGMLTSVSQSRGTLFYSYTSIYGTDGNLMRQGKFLQDATGKILGHSIEDISESDLCDGCALPTYTDDIQGRRPPVLNLISISGLAYPMVLEDSGTVEGRALDLFTFTAAGQSSEFRAYEYVVTCILGEDLK